MLKKNKKQESLRNLRTMLGYQVLVLAVILISLSNVASAAKGGNGKGKGNGGGNDGDVGGDVSGWIYCRVTFNDSGPVQSDGLGEYLDGVDRAESRPRAPPGELEIDGHTYRLWYEQIPDHALA